MIKMQRLLLALLPCVLLSACGTFLEKDNTPPPSPLVQFTPKINPRSLWNNRVSSGSSQDYLNLVPALANNEIITVDAYGTLTAVDKNNGNTQWKAVVPAAVTSGPAVGDNIIVVGTKNGEVIALNLFNRTPAWKADVGSEILATPAIHNNVVLIKSINGKVTAFSSSDGHLLWVHREDEPNLILRGASAPQIVGNSVIIGYASGKVVKLSLKDGHELWSLAITLPDGAFAIQRMIDVDADPVVFGNRVFAATYQGKIAAIDFNSGHVLWDNSMSSYSGLAVDESHVYVSDTKSNVWAFDKENGRVVWKQTQLEARHTTGPVLLGNTLVVGDGGGVLSWLNKQDGSFVGRAQLGGSGIVINPVAQNNALYALTKDGYLAAYRVN